MDYFLLTSSFFGFMNVTGHVFYVKKEFDLNKVCIGKTLGIFQILSNSKKKSGEIR